MAPVCPQRCVPVLLWRGACPAVQVSCSAHDSWTGQRMVREGCRSMLGSTHKIDTGHACVSRKAAYRPSHTGLHASDDGRVGCQHGLIDGLHRQAPHMSWQQHHIFGCPEEASTLLPACGLRMAAHSRHEQTETAGRAQLNTTAPSPAGRG